MSDKIFFKCQTIRFVMICKVFSKLFKTATLTMLKSLYPESNNVSHIVHQSSLFTDNHNQLSKFLTLIVA